MRRRFLPHPVQPCSAQCARGVSLIVCVGETFVDLLAQSQVADVGDSEFFRRAAGGAVSNVAIGIARLGGSAAFVGTVGRDPLGRFLVRTLAHENVDVDGVRVVDAVTSAILVARGPDGGRDFYPLTKSGAETALAPQDLNASTFARAVCVHFGGVVLAGEPGRSACMAAARLAPARAFVSFDPNVRPRIFSDRDLMRRVTLEACRTAHLVKCSEEDLDALGLADRDPSQLLGGKTVAAIVTQGARGCRWATKDGAGSAPAPHVVPVDTTGAGDAFMAALLWRVCAHHHGRLDAASMADASLWAAAAGAGACAKEGAIASLPRVARLEAMLQRSAT